jgi:hypothetical protein
MSSGAKDGILYDAIGIEKREKLSDRHE